MAQQIAPPSTPYGAPNSIDDARRARAPAEAEATKNNWGVAIASSGRPSTVPQTISTQRLKLNTYYKMPFLDRFYDADHD